MYSTWEAINKIKNKRKFRNYKLNTSKHQLNITEIEEKKFKLFSGKEIQLVIVLSKINENSRFGSD